MLVIKYKLLSIQVNYLVVGQKPWSSGYGKNVPKVMGSNPGTTYWMDFFTYICCKNCDDVCLKRLKINEKEAGAGPFLSI